MSSNRCPTLVVLDEQKSQSPFQASTQRLTELAERMDRREPFHKGCIVTWKAGLRNRRLPAYDSPAIVREVLSAPLFDKTETTSASPYFNEPLDLKIAVMDDDGDFLEFYVSGSRFEMVPDVRVRC